jgi:hypothetical protein
VPENAGLDETGHGIYPGLHYPTPYFTPRQLRTILYDHLYNRHTWHSPETAQSAPRLVSQSFTRLQEFCQVNRDKTFGVGVIYDGIWYPQAQVEWPKSFLDVEETSPEFLFRNG